VISLKFLEIKLDIKYVLIENIGLLGIFILYGLKDRLSVKDLSEVTMIDEELLEEKISLLRKRGYLDGYKLTEKGFDIIKIYDFINRINNSSIFIDVYLKEFYFISSNKLSNKPKFKVYPQKLFDYGLLKKINENKKKILSHFNVHNLNLNYDFFELSFKVKRVWFADFDEIIFGRDKFAIGEKVLKISYDVRNLKNEVVKGIFEDFYFSLFNKEKYKNIKKYLGKIYLPVNYSLDDIECNKIPDLNKLCLLNIKINLEEFYNKKFINIKEMIRKISESD